MAHENLGDALMQQGQKDEARRELRRTIQIGTPAEAIVDANKLLAANP